MAILDYKGKGNQLLSPFAKSFDISKESKAHLLLDAISLRYFPLLFLTRLLSASATASSLLMNEMKDI